MEIEKIDDKSREVLKYLNTHSDLSSTVLATVFNQHYKNDLSNALSVLSFLEKKSMVELKTDNNETAIMIQVTHLGQMYEYLLIEQEKEIKKKLWSDRRWNIITLILSAIITIIINLIMGG